MQVVEFDNEIFDMLIKCGFRYCYSKTVAINGSYDGINIILTPVRFEPDIHKLPDEYDTYFDLTEEPKQMMAGIDAETLVFIDLNDTLLKEYYG